VGQEINRTRFSDDDFAQFERRLADETGRLAGQIRDCQLSAHDYRIGFEIEAWLVDHNLTPAPVNFEYLAALQDPLVVPELSRFNVELNCTPRLLQGAAFTQLEDELRATWQRCALVSHDMDSALLLIGILPTIRDTDLTLANVSSMRRFVALNEQILRRRGGRPLTIDIEGHESLHLVHDDVMLEAAATSFQVHLQVPADETRRYYNASLIASAPVLALGVNSPFLFGRQLWQETRIPLFEQAVAILPPDADPADRRVSFGSGYLLHGMDEYFYDNLRRYAVLLPILDDGAPERYPHLRLHNGTIWRWNRPLVGFDDDGTPHLRIEHRVLPAGPSLIDMLANAAFYVGLVTMLATRDPPPEQQLPFETARANFYAAARHGLDARLDWLSLRTMRVRDLLLDELLPLARTGLKHHDIDARDIERYFDILEARVKSGQTGADWLRAYTSRHGRDFLKLSAAYLENQRSGAPVHEWPL